MRQNSKENKKIGNGKFTLCLRALGIYGDLIISLTSCVSVNIVFSDLSCGSPTQLFSWLSFAINSLSKINCIVMSYLWSYCACLFYFTVK